MYRHNATIMTYDFRPFSRMLMRTTCAAIILVGAATSAMAEAPLVRGQRIRDFARISFEWPEKTEFSTQNNGKQVQIRFNRKASPDLSSMLGSLSGIVEKASMSGDGKTLTLELADEYRTRNFISGNLVGLDVLGVDKAPPKEKAPTQKPELKQVSANKPDLGDDEIEDIDVEKTVVAKKREPEKKTAAPKTLEKTNIEKELQAALPLQSVNVEDDPLEAIEQAALNQATKVAPAKPVPVLASPKPVLPPEKEPLKPVVTVENKPVEKPQQVVDEKQQLDKNQQNLEMVLSAAQRAKIASTKEMPSEPLVEAKVGEKPLSVTNEPPKQAEPVIAQAPIENVVPTVTENVDSTLSSAAQEGVLKVTAQEDLDGIQINLQSTKRLAAAAYKRGGVVWVVVSEALPIKPDIAPTFANKLRLLPVSQQPENATVMAFEAPTFSGARMRAISAGGWSLTLTESPTAPNVPIRLEPRSEEGQPAYLLANALETSPPLQLRDPRLGDTLTVVPVFVDGAGVLPGRTLVDMELLESAQGIVFKALRDNVKAEVQRNGLAILSPDGLNISPQAVVTGGEQRNNINEGMIAKDTFFPAEEWMLKKDETFLSKRQELQKVFASDEGMQANMARLELAKLYISEGMPAEALGLLDVIKSKDLAFYIDQKVSAVAGLANYLVGRYDEALRAFSTQELGDGDEVAFWKAMLSEYVEGANTGFDYNAFQSYYLRRYPKEAQQKVALWAVERAVRQEQYNQALATLKLLEDADLVTSRMSPALDYWKGVIAARNNEMDEAKKLLESVMTNLDTRDWRARATLEWLKINKEQGTLQPELLTEKLEHLRYIWRDDLVELQALQMLADTYEEMKNYRQALRILKEIVLSYPRTAQAFKSTESMSRIFNYLFNENGDQNMKPLDALTLYYEFKDLTPVEADGDLMVRNLADRLVRVDLLERASGLLDHQVRNRLTGQLRSEVGAQLALLYLLDRKPEKALQALEISGYGENPAELQLQRARLTSRALADLGEPERALRLLKDDFAQEAQWLKLEIYWNQGDWKQVAALAEDVLGQRPDPTQVLNLHESEVLLKLGVAYTLQNERGQVQYLRDYFTPLMKDSPHKELFAYITSDAAVTPENMGAVAQNIQQMQSFLGSYHQRIQVEGLNAALTSAAMKPKEEAAPAPDNTVASDATTVSETPAVATDAPPTTAADQVAPVTSKEADAANTSETPAAPVENQAASAPNTTATQSPAQP